MFDGNNIADATDGKKGFKGQIINIYKNGYKDLYNVLCKNFEEYMTEEFDM